jgi:hypothetical protein
MPIKDITSDSSNLYGLGRKIFSKTDNSTTPPYKKWYGNSTSRDSSFVSKKKTDISIGKKTFEQTNVSYHNKDTNVVNQALMRVRSSGSTVPPKVSQKMFL